METLLLVLVNNKTVNCNKQWTT